MNETRQLKARVDIKNWSDFCCCGTQARLAKTPEEYEVFLKSISDKRVNQNIDRELRMVGFRVET